MAALSKDGVKSHIIKVVDISVKLLTAKNS